MSARKNCSSALYPTAVPHSSVKVVKGPLCYSLVVVIETPITTLVADTPQEIGQFSLVLLNQKLTEGIVSSGFDLA